MELSIELKDKIYVVLNKKGHWVGEVTVWIPADKIEEPMVGRFKFSNRAVREEFIKTMEDIMQEKYMGTRRQKTLIAKILEEQE